MPHILDYDNTVTPENKVKVSQMIRKTYLAEKEVTTDTYLDLVQVYIYAIIAINTENSNNFK